MNAGMQMTLYNVQTYLRSMDILLDNGKMDEARNALADARREAEILLQMIDTINGAWSTMMPGSVKTVVHLIREGRTLCGRFTILGGIPLGHRCEEPPCDDADCEECLMAWRVNYLK
jgi:hypothetical protein